MHVELPNLKIYPQVFHFLRFNVGLDELENALLQMHEVGDGLSSALEVEPHWAPPALLDNGMGEAGPVPTRGLI